MLVHAVGELFFKKNIATHRQELGTIVFYYPVVGANPYITLLILQQCIGFIGGKSIPGSKLFETELLARKEQAARTQQQRDNY
jgi:hypothetical protein